MKSERGLEDWQEDFIARLAAIKGPPWGFQLTLLNDQHPPIRRTLEGVGEQCPLSAIIDEPKYSVGKMDEAVGPGRRIAIIQSADGHTWSKGYSPAFRRAMLEALGLDEPRHIPGRPAGGAGDPHVVDDMGMDQGGGLPGAPGVAQGEEEGARGEE